MFTPHLSHNKFPEIISAELPLPPSVAAGAGCRNGDVLPRSFLAGWSIPIFYPFYPFFPSSSLSPTRRAHPCLICVLTILERRTGRPRTLSRSPY